MSVESAWDAELAAAGEVMGADVDRLAERNRELLAEVERLRAANEGLRAENAEYRRLLWKVGL